MSDTKPTIVKVPAFAVVLTRGGKRVELPAGKAAKFTKAEIDEIAEIDENALRDPSEEAAALLALQGGSDQEDGSDPDKGKDAETDKTGGDTSGKASGGARKGASKTGDEGL